jgi:uncharacterized protein HemX
MFMTLGPIEILMILAVVALVIALAFRTGITRGGQQRNASAEKKPAADADKCS